MNYCLSETELESVSYMNGEALRSFSLAGFLISFVINVYVGAAFSGGKPSDAGMSLLHSAWISGLIAVYLLGNGFWALYRRKGLIAKIIKESEARPIDK